MPQDNTLSIDAIMLPIDMRHKEDSARALAMAAQLAKTFSAKLYVMTAARPLGDEIGEFPEHHQPEFDAFLKQMAKQHGVSIEPLFRHHESAEKMILETAEEIGADVIVMATHDPKLTDHLFGSHTSHVALNAKCSVMVVR